jgi:hypothetical protein
VFGGHGQRLVSRIGREAEHADPLVGQLRHSRLERRELSHTVGHQAPRLTRTTLYGPDRSAGSVRRSSVGEGQLQRREAVASVQEGCVRFPCHGSRRKGRESAAITERWTDGSLPEARERSGESSGPRAAARNRSAEGRCNGDAAVHPGGSGAPSGGHVTPPPMPAQGRSQRAVEEGAERCVHQRLDRGDGEAGAGELQADDAVDERHSVSARAWTSAPGWRWPESRNASSGSSSARYARCPGRHWPRTPPS